MVKYKRLCVVLIISILLSICGNVNVYASETIINSEDSIATLKEVENIAINYVVEVMKCGEFEGWNNDLVISKERALFDLKGGNISLLYKF